VGRGNGGRGGAAGSRHRIYCAGPLFNHSEQEEMAAIAHTLEAAGFSTFLPHKDSFVFPDAYREFLREGYDPREATRMIQEAIFSLDAYEIISACHGLVLNMNGRVPDEGAVAEAAMAWTAGKVVVLYKSDSRSLIHGQDNALLAGLGDFQRVSTLQEIAYAFAQLFRARRSGPEPTIPRAVRKVVDAGRRLSRSIVDCKSTTDIILAIAALTRSIARPSRR
jgi:nucleoside 2-deoxyribosyltransferase